MSDNETLYGEVVFFNNKTGYGFISWESNGEKQKDMFCHYSDIDCEGFKTLVKGQKVSFKMGANFHGQPKAVEVIVLKH